MSSQPPSLKVQVWIYWKNLENPTLLFLILHTHSTRGGFWQPVTGGVEPGESLLDAAQREAEEETGLIFPFPPQSLEKNFEFVSRGRVNREYGYFLAVSGDEKTLPKIRLDQREHTDYLWVPAEIALEKVRYPSNREMLQLLVDRLA